jgi:hypothetical protein
MTDFNLIMERYVNRPYTFELDNIELSVRIIYDPKVFNQNGHRLIVMTDDRTIMDEWFYDPQTFRLHQYKFWSIFGVPLIYHYKVLGTISNYTIKVFHKLFFFPPISNDRTEWDITIHDEQTIKEYCSSSGEWTDIVYNEDGTFTHIPTKEEDIPQYEICG